MKVCKRVLLTTAVLVSMICSLGVAQAHDTWVTPSVFQAVKGTTPDYTVANSHHFPASAEDTMAADRLDKLFAVGPDGKPVSQNASLSQTGTYVAVAVPVNGFATKTPDGYQRGKNKTQVDNPILCRKSMKFAKSIFTVGPASGDAWGKSLGHAMEIVPLKDPATLKAGDVSWRLKCFWTASLPEPLCSEPMPDFQLNPIPSGTPPGRIKRGWPGLSSSTAGPGCSLPRLKRLIRILKPVMPSAGPPP